MSKEFVHIGSVIINPAKVSDILLSNDMLTITVYYATKKLPFAQTTIKYDTQTQALEAWDRLLNALCD